MTPPPSNLVPEQASVPTLDPTESPSHNPPKPQTRASDLDASEAGVQTSAVSPDRVAATGAFPRWLTTLQHSLRAGSSGPATRLCAEAGKAPMRWRQSTS